MIRRTYRPSTIAVLVLFVVVLVAVRLWQESHAPPPPPEAMPAGEYKLLRVVDGDTILLSNHARVRLIGVNAPESVKPDSPVEPWGPEASEFTKKFLAGGTVRLQLDQERTDQFGRFLAYVWAKDPETGQERMLNEELLRAGMARATLWYHFSQSMKQRFRRAEDEARRAHRGIWSGAVKTGVEDKSPSGAARQRAEAGGELPIAR